MKAPTCIYCAAAARAGNEVVGGQHAPTPDKCDWHPWLKEVPEPILPGQCKRLFAAVLRLAICDARGRGFDAMDARRWMEDDAPELGSFAFCCDLFDLDPDSLLEAERRRWRKAA